MSRCEVLDDITSAATPTLQVTLAYGYRGVILDDHLRPSPETSVLIGQTSSDWLELHALTNAAVRNLRNAADSQETNVTVVIVSATPETSVLIRQTSSDWLELHAVTNAAVRDAAGS